MVWVAALSQDNRMKHYFTYTEELLQTLRSFVKSDNACAQAVAINLFPEFMAFFESGNENAAAFAIEHDSDLENVLWSHLENVLANKLLGVEKRDLSLFQKSNVLEQSHFMRLCDAFEYIDQKVHLAPVLRAALVYSNISKGGSRERRHEWKTRLGMDLTLHNEASALLLKKTSLLNRYAEFRHSAILQSLAIFMVKAHGMMGQYIRGEITDTCFSAYIDEMHMLCADLCDPFQWTWEESVHAVVTLYWLMNVLDTSAVRDGLMDDALLEQFEAFALQIENAVLGKAPLSRYPETTDIAVIRKLLEQRMLSMRKTRILEGESPSTVQDALNLMNDADIVRFYSDMRLCQLWYFEAATGRLSAQSQLKLLAMGLYMYHSKYHVQNRVFHLDFLNIANTLFPYSKHIKRSLLESRANYRIRILDTILSMQEIGKILDGTADIYHNPYIFMMNSQRGGQNSISIDISESEESNALITLLSIYESKSTVAFHSALKMLCDLYQLRKDDFDRLSNESQYLITMNAAKHDKARMLPYLKPGKIVEVGPGGGVVLDLLASYFTDSDIIGLDASHQVVVSLEQRKKQTQAHWNIIEGNAFNFTQYFPKESLDSIVFCSILHEIYSYIEADDGTRFHLESVQRMLQSAFDALRPGGRILIRDGIMPEHQPQYLTFTADDAKPFFEAFCREFKGRTVQYETIDDTTVLLDSADAMEFMYTYTWGPESFPYEVREQYGIMTYTDYCKSIQSWLGDKARLVEIPADEALVLQPGYVTALKDKVKLCDIHHQPVSFPPSNAIIVIEKI